MKAKKTSSLKDVNPKMKPEIEDQRNGRGKSEVEESISRIYPFISRDRSFVTDYRPHCAYESRKRDKIRKGSFHSMVSGHCIMRHFM